MPLKTCNNARHPDGFSLVELSIVLVILGLLVGGVLAGQSLIRAAELRSLSTDMTRFNTATQTFRDKYFAIPGDMANATQFWGAQDAGDGLGTDCTNVSSSGILTCNGDGNGTVCATNGQCYESHRFWQHLANAGLIEGSFTGIARNTTNQSGSTAGVNAPLMRMANITAQPREIGVVSGFADLYDGNYNGSFYVGKPACATCNPNGAFLKTEEAWNIDTKIDDGKPALGRLRTYKFGNATAWAADSANCADSATPASAQYNLSLSDINCGLVFIFQ